jgi:CDK-activating kinase assembly factor MAT1
VFESIKIERECDIRRRVAATLNLREEDFNTLREFNDYEELKEVTVWNLINGTDVAESEALLKSHEKENKERIAQNKAIEEQEALQVAELEVERLQKTAQHRHEILEEIAMEKKEKEAGNEQFLERLQRSDGNAEEIARQDRQKVILKKSSARRTAIEKDAAVLPSTSASGPKVPTISVTAGSGIRGLKAVKVVEPEKPYDPFGGHVLARKYYRPKETFEHDWLEKARTDPVITAGGFSVREYYDRAMVEAHAGLGVNIAEEKAQSQE